MKQAKKIGALASALIIASQMSLGVAQATATPEDAQIIAGFVSNAQYLELRDYITDNPQLLDGGGALASALREFYEQATNIDSAGVARVDLQAVDDVFEQASIY